MSGHPLPRVDSFIDILWVLFLHSKELKTHKSAVFWPAKFHMPHNASWSLKYVKRYFKQNPPIIRKHYNCTSRNICLNWLPLF